MYWQFAEQWENSVVTLHLLNEHLNGDKVVGRGYGSLFYWDYNLTEHKLNGVTASILYWYFHKNKIGVKTGNSTNLMLDDAIYEEPQQLTAIRHLMSFLKTIR